MNPKFFPVAKQHIASGDIETAVTSTDLVETYDATNQNERKALSLATLFSRAPALVPQALEASGAIDADATFVTLDSTTPLIAATVAAPAPGRFLIITQIDAGTAGHTVTLTAGTWDGTNDVATFNAAGETLIVFGVTATRFVIVENIGAVAFS